MNEQQTPQQPQAPAPITPSAPATAPIPPVKAVVNVDTLLPWGTQKNNYHNTRVLCDLSGLTLNDKNILCACIYQESQFRNYLPDGQPVMDDDGNSKDWGICQINDNPKFLHICPKGCDFISVQEVLDNPQKAVQYMITMYKAGRITEWDSYSSGAYLEWLKPNSPMWALATD